jgi:hypothetical protein
VKLTNNSLGPKAISTTDRGVVVLAKGESADLNVSDADAAAIEKHKLLEAPETGGVPSLADLQREIASNSLTAADLTGDKQPTTDEDDPDADLPAEDDPDVVAMIDANTSAELQKLADDNKVDMTGARNKTDAARRIVAAQRAAADTGSGTGGEA